VSGSVGCPACGSDATRVFYEQAEVPSHSCLLMDTKEQALAFPRGRIALTFCDACAFVFNAAADPTLQAYSSTYEETQGFSPRFRAFARDLAGRWVRNHALAGRQVLEIGCGKGEFLAMMVEEGAAGGVGIDPAVAPARMDESINARIQWIPELYSEAYTDLTGDAVVCRHTLEHINDVEDFMALVRRGIGDRPETTVLFELPDVVRVLREAAFWDIYYEHCSYFSPGSLARLFRRTGFEVTDVAYDYDDQYILLEAKPSAVPAPGDPLPLEETPAELGRDVDAFAERFAATRDHWNGVLRERRAKGEKVALWGSGSKGVAFLVTLDAGPEIGAVVDINPYKHGKFMAGTGWEIVAPDFLVEYRPDLVIAMNPVYIDEIQGDLDRLGIQAELVAV
jgi:hypothetical protein